MSSTRQLITTAAAASLLLACNLFSLPTATSTPGSTATIPTNNTSTPSQPAATPTAAPPTATATSALGTVQGQVCYPSDFIPAMNLYFENVNTGEVVSVTHPEGAGQSYGEQLPPGTYFAYAWRVDGALGGSYSHAVPCGLTTNCTNHNLLSFTVNAGSTTSDIDICDWYGGQGSVPTPPSN